MFDSKETIEIEKISSYFNLVLAGIIIVYYLLFGFFKLDNLRPNDIVFALSIFMLGVDFILGKSEYFKSDFLIKIIKFCELLLFSVFAFHSNGFVPNILISGLMYFLISLQVLVLFDITEIYSKIEVVAFNSVPIAVAIFIYVFSNRNIDKEALIYICAIFIIIVCEISVTNSLALVFDKLYKKIFALNGALSANKEENDTMKTTQEKLVHANEQLSLQRFKLEKANEQILKNNEEEKLLNMINKDLSIITDIDILINKICKNIMKYMNTDFCYIGLLNNEDLTESSFIKTYDYNKDSKINEANTIFFESSNLVKKFSEEAVMVINDNFAHLKQDWFRGSEIQSSILYSVNIGDTHSAVYMIGKIYEKAFTDNRIFINNLFSQISLTINNVLLYSKMHNMAVKDALTNIYNRQYFNSIYTSLIDKIVNEDKEMTVVLFDIDKFKSINDTYGHIFGDEVIRYCGQMALKYSNINESFAVRYGGEEFVMIFPDMNLNQVLAVCKEMHEEIQKKVFFMDGSGVHINVSIGIASYPENCYKADELIDSADKAMYYSKKNGRGRITVFSDEVNSL